MRTSKIILSYKNVNIFPDPKVWLRIPAKKPLVAQGGSGSAILFDFNFLRCMIYYVLCIMYVKLLAKLITVFVLFIHYFISLF